MRHEESPPRWLHVPQCEHTQHGAAAPPVSQHQRKRSDMRSDRPPEPQFVSRGPPAPLAVTGVLFAFWYLMSLCTLLLNKHILNQHGGSVLLLACVQMVCTFVLGACKLHVDACSTQACVYTSKDLAMTHEQREGTAAGSIWVVMGLLGGMRLATVMLGLVSLDNVAVSFTETIKSTAPLFTVFLSFVLIGQRTSLLVMLSLIPIMAGLALCSANEISFNLLGFGAALATNTVDCLQNVFSKKLMTESYSPLQLQFYASSVAVFIQVPLTIYLMSSPNSEPLSLTANSAAAAARQLAPLVPPQYVLPLLLLADGLCFHGQSLSAFMLVGRVTPVTFSVANTVKRALLIWISVLTFHNQVTPLTIAGTATVLAGVFGYIYAKSRETRRASESSRV